MKINISISFKTFIPKEKSLEIKAIIQLPNITVFLYPDRQWTGEEEEYRGKGNWEMNDIVFRMIFIFYPCLCLK